MNTVQKNLVGLAVVAVVGGAVATYAWLRAGEEDARPRGADKRLFTGTPADATRLEIEAPGKQLVVVKDAGSWRIEKPVKMAADDDKVVALVGRVLAVEARQVFGRGDAPDPPADAVSGLAQPTERATVTLGGATPTTKAVIELGVESAFDHSVYARAQEGADAPVVAQVPASLRRELGKPWLDVVDRRALGADPLEVVKLRVVPGAPAADRIAWAIERAPGGSSSTQEWRVVEPFVGEADDNAARAAVDGLFSAPVADFLAEDKGADLAKWGLDAPAWIVTATVKIGDAPAVERVLRIAPRPDKPGEVFLTRDDQPWVGAANAELDDGLAKDEAALKSKDLFAFDREAVQRVEIVRPTTKIVIERGETRASDWKMLSPEPAVVKAYRANGLVFTFAEMKGERREADAIDAATLARTGLGEGASTIAFYDPSGKKLGALRVGSVVGDEAYVMAEGGAFVAVVPKTRVDELPTKPSDLLK